MVKTISIFRKNWGYEKDIKNNNRAINYLLGGDETDEGWRNSAFCWGMISLISFLLFCCASLICSLSGLNHQNIMDSYLAIPISFLLFIWGISFILAIFYLGEAPD